MEKVYISANELLLDSFRLAEKIIASGFRPDFSIGVWRGGAPVGIAIQEYLAYVGVATAHIAIRTSSYVGINEQEKTVRVHGLDYIIDNVNAEDDVLLVDDSIVRGNTAPAGAQIAVHSSLSTVSMHWTNLEGGTAGVELSGGGTTPSADDGGHGGCVGWLTKRARAMDATLGQNPGQRVDHGGVEGFRW